MINKQILNKQFLQSIPIFQRLDEDALEYLYNISTLSHLKKDNTLFYEGDVSENLHLVVEGTIAVCKINAKAKEIILKEFTPYSFIAEVSNYSHIAFPASAKATTKSSVLCINYEAFEKKLLNHPAIAPTIIKSMANKVISLEKVISSHLVLDATQRVAKFIYENELCFQNLKHHQIAKNLNITPVTFSRILKKFKEQEILIEEKNTYTIVNKKMLQTLFS
jgi:CRP/FNR family transcriptional regulator